jgi:hypothetical protein
MLHKSKEEPRKLPGLVATLSSGFEFTTNHIWLIVIPIFLDVFYWLGPRLSVQSIVESNIAALPSEPSLEEATFQVIELVSKINLFTSLSIPLIGVPALMNGTVPEATPLNTTILEVKSPFLWLFLFIELSILGLLLATFYLSLIGWVMNGEQNIQRRSIGLFTISVGIASLRILGLGVVFLSGLLVLLFPLLPIAFILSLLGTNLSVAVIAAGILLVATYLSLAVPAIVLDGSRVLPAVVGSLRVVHRNLQPTFTLLFAILVSGAGMNYLWHLADDGSWLTAVSIAGHAFVSTSFVTAIFIYYRDRTASQVTPIEEVEISGN